MDVLRMMKRLRHHDIALKNSILTSKERKLQVKHARKYVLDIDSDPESEHDKSYTESDIGTPYNNYERLIHDNLNMAILHKEGKSRQLVEEMRHVQMQQKSFSFRSAQDPSQL